MKRWFRNWWTAHRLRILLQYGLCPNCNSSPPTRDCYVCQGDFCYGNHGPNKIWEQNYGRWARRYIQMRRWKDI